MPGIATVSGQQESPQVATLPRQVRTLRMTSLIEGSTLVLLLLVAVPLKHFGGWPAAVAVLGPVHGLASLFYMLAMIENVAAGDWTRGEAARLLLAAFVPFGGFLNLRFLSRKAIAGSRPVTGLA